MQARLNIFNSQPELPLFATLFFFATKIAK
jgi:hypothetical protein